MTYAISYNDGVLDIRNTAAAIEVLEFGMAKAQCSVSAQAASFPFVRKVLDRNFLTAGSLYPMASAISSCVWQESHISKAFLRNLALTSLSVRTARQVTFFCRRIGSYMEQEGPLVGVIRIGSKERIEQVARGLLYMNTLEYFIKLEADILRGDSGEATSHIFRGDGAVLHIKIGGEFKPVGELHGPIRYRSDENLKMNVFCMYALRESPSGVVVDPRNFDFGDTVAIFTDFDEFTRRVQSAVVPTGQSVQWAPVDYIDYATYQGPTGVFKKDCRFSYQSELRLVLVPGFGTAHQLNVGDLSDIIRIGRSEDLRHITFRRNP